MDKLRDLVDAGAVLAWFYRMLRNAVVDHHRRSGAARRALDAFASEIEVTDRDGIERDRTCRCISRAAKDLKPEYAAALQRIEVDGISVKEHADEAGITSSNAGVRVFRARAALRKAVESECGPCAARGCTDCTCGTE